MPIVNNRTFVAARRALLFAIAITVVPGGCSLTPAIPVYPPQEMALLPVTNRGNFTGSWADESFVFGPYQVSQVDRRGVRSSGWSVPIPVGTIGNTSTTSGYTFTFTAPGGHSQGECSTQFGQRQKFSSFAAESSQVGCRCAGGGLNSEVMMSGPGGAWQGQAMLHGYPVPMRSFSEYTNGVTSSLPFGFEVRAQNVLGAMASKRPGKVWLAHNLDPLTHAELACLFAGFLLYQQPKNSRF